MVVRVQASILFPHSYGAGKGTVCRVEENPALLLRGSCQHTCTCSISCVSDEGSTRDGPGVTIGRILKLIWCIHALIITETTCR